MAVISIVTVCVFSLRAKVLPGQTLTVTVNDVPCLVRRLGHNAAEPRGYHPYLIVTDIDHPPLPGQTFTLTTNGQVTRVLLGSADALRSTP